MEQGSPSLDNPDYWWYRTRSDLLQRGLAGYVPAGAHILDVGSADGPSVAWLRDRGLRVAMDIDPRGLGPGDVCASALALPFRSGSFDVVAAFDVLEHLEPEEGALSEFVRVLRPGGTLLLSMPAYQWAWTSHDDLNHHHRRYTRGRAVAAAERAGFSVMRSSYIFAGSLPAFAIARLVTRLRERRAGEAPTAGTEALQLPVISPVQERILDAATAVDRRLVARWDLPFGSSVILAAEKPASAAELVAS
ncbi:class I SAM-dependent methyltransferase [Nocardioides astragali]|uniref:Class I SAM-dependent methyltransferase n=1 Tax=Nocardioides astragali TaxID=1776736 RepID=A0ABW2NAK2_9ACTN|nr:class I SAM-dependent methyltransferase [Nocardioides astragali]